MGGLGACMHVIQDLVGRMNTILMLNHVSIQFSGMDFYVCLERPGFSVARRRAQKNRVGVQHKVTKDDAIKWWVASLIRMLFRQQGRNMVSDVMLLLFVLLGSRPSSRVLSSTRPLPAKSFGPPSAVTIPVTARTVTPSPDQHQNRMA